MYVTQNESEYLNDFLTGIIEGTDPESSSYWGKTKDYDQLIVEMAALSTFLLLNKEKRGPINKRTAKQFTQLADTSQ